MDNDSLLLKKRILETAIDLYLEDPGRLTVDDLIETAGISKDDFYACFDSILFVLPAFYDLCLVQYRALREEIEGYEIFSLEERLSTFIFILFDLLEEQETFVGRTFEAYVVQDQGTSRFRQDVTLLFGELLDTDDVPSANRFFTDQSLLHSLLTTQYLFLVSSWIRDESPQREQTIALTDKLVAFFAELATFRGIERGIDLAKYLVNVGIIKIDTIPFVGPWFDDANRTT